MNLKTVFPTQYFRITREKTRETQTKLYRQNLTRTDHLGDLNVDGTILTCILNKAGVKMTGFIRLETGSRRSNL
jgi:hypothetical protein